MINKLKTNLCYVCNDVIVEQISWTRLFSPVTKKYLCVECHSRLVKNTYNTCVKCDRPKENDGTASARGQLCFDCERWESHPDWAGLLDRNYSLFLYDDFLKELIANFKYRGDYALSYVFKAEFLKQLRLINYDIITAIPLSNERLYERGFNQASALAEISNINWTQLLKREGTEKQAKKSRQERLKLEQLFKLQTDLNLNGKTIVIIDDIYTTGTTLRHAAKLLKQAGATTVKSITIARS